MIGIYLTQEGKQEIEAKIAELENTRKESSSDNNDYYLGRIKELKEILSSATILPVEESWGNMPIGVNESELSYPQGVIIQPKQ
jgi:transcription elongation GreA/GreB family factor